MISGVLVMDHNTVSCVQPLEITEDYPGILIMQALTIISGISISSAQISHMMVIQPQTKRTDIISILRLALRGDYHPKVF
jgi:hypothetical protein